MKKWMCLLLAIIMLTSLVLPVSAASVPTYSISAPKRIAIDGQVTEKEWGKPIYKGVTLKKAEERKIDDQLYAWWFDTLHNEQASFDLYATNNDIGVGFACVVHNVPPETTDTRSLWQLMNFTFTLSKWEDPGGVPSIQKDDGRYEVYSGFRLNLMSDGQMKQQVITQGLTTYELFRGHDFQIKYDINTHTITYEVVVPYEVTNIVPAKNEYIAFSAVIALNFSGNSVSGYKDGSNRFIIGSAAALCGKANNFAHKDHCIKIKLAPYDEIAKWLNEDADTAVSEKTGVNINPDLINTPQNEENLQTGSSDTVRWVLLGISAVIILLCSVFLICMLIRTCKKKKGGRM